MSYFFCAYLPGYIDLKPERKIIWHVLLSQSWNSEKPTLLCANFLIFPPKLFNTRVCICIYIQINVFSMTYLILIIQIQCID